MQDLAPSSFATGTELLRGMKAPRALSGRLRSFRPTGPSLMYQDLLPVIDAIEESRRLRTAILVDLSAIDTVNGTTAALLLDLACLADGIADLAFLSPTPKLGRALRRAGIADALPLHESRSEALAATTIRHCTLPHAKAVILAAGEGSRARPLTHAIPKPLLKVLDRPIMDWMIDHLASFGISRLAINAGHLATKLEDHANGIDPSIDILVTREWRNWNGRNIEGPVGSATTLHRLARQGWVDRPVIVTCGDTLADVNLAAMMAQHVESGSSVTLALSEVPEEMVSRYGIVDMSEDGSIWRFQEKPSREKAASRLANMGIYIFSPEVLLAMPEKDGLDIGSDLLPFLLASGHKIGGWRHEGGWLEVGTADDLRRVNLEAAMGRAPLAHCPALTREERIHVGCGATIGYGTHIEGPVFIGENASIGRNCRLIGPAVIEEGTRIGDGAIIENGLVLSGAEVPRNSRLVGKLALPKDLDASTDRQECSRAASARPFPTHRETENSTIPAGNPISAE